MPADRLSQMNLLNHFNSFKKQNVDEEVKTENSGLDSEPQFEDFVEWLINKDDYSQGSSTKNA